MSDREKKIGKRKSEPQRPAGTPQARHGPAHGRGRRGGRAVRRVPHPPQPRTGGRNPRGFGSAGSLLVASLWPQVLCAGPRPAGQSGLCRPLKHGPLSSHGGGSSLCSPFPCGVSPDLDTPQGNGSSLHSCPRVRIPGGAEQPGVQGDPPFSDDRLGLHYASSARGGSTCASV